MLVLHLPLLHCRINHQLVQLKAGRRTTGIKVRKEVYEPLSISAFLLWDYTSAT